MIELIRFSPSRLAFTYVALSVLALALFAIPLWYAWSVNLHMFREYVAAVDVAQMVDKFEREGAAGLAAAIDSQTPSLAPDRIVVLADPSKMRLAGNLPAWPTEVPDVPGTYGLAIGGVPTSLRIVGSHIALPDGYHLLVARESARFQSLVEYFWFGIAGATVIVLVIGALIGWRIRRALLLEVQEIGGTAKAIVAGDLSRRLPTRHGPDALAALAYTVNEMLEELASKNVQLAGEVATRRQAEEALHQAHQTLEKLVERRTGELQQTEARFEGIVAIADDAIISVDSSQRILLFNRGAEKVFGYSQSEIQGELLDRLMPRRFASDHRQHLVAFAQSADIARTMGQRREVFGVRKDGREFPAEASISKLDVDGELVFTVILRDITKRKQAEALLAGEKRLLEVIAKGAPLRLALDALCGLAEEVDLDWRVSILLLDRGGLRHGTAPSLPDAYVERIDGSPVGVGIGPCALAAHLSKPVITADLAGDERWSPQFQALAASHGLRACWSTPITSSDRRVLGTFAIYPREPKNPTAEQQSHIERLTHLASIAIERSEAIDALRRSEERYALAMQASGEGHWDWDIPSDKLYVSPLLLDICGLPSDTTFASRTEFVERIPFEHGERVRYDDAVAEHFAGKTDRLDTDIRIMRQGQPRWLHLTGRCSLDAGDKPIRWAGSVTDVTARKQAAEELRESEARFRALTALWSDWYWRQDEDLRFTYSTAAIDPPEGYPGGSAIGKTRWELPDIAPLSSSWAEHKALLAAHKPFRDFEYSRPAVDGTLCYVSTSGTPIFDENGRFRGYHGVGRNITERKRVEQELRSRQEMLEMAQKAARVVAFEYRVDAGTGENRWSPDLEAMYGIPSGSYDGTYESWKKLVYRADWPNVRAAIKAAQQTGDVDAEYRVMHADGAIRWLHAKGQMFLDSGGRPIRIVGFMLDVTDRHLAEEELQRMERELRQAQRLEAMGTLAGGIAHDFNNLLGAILGYGEMALSESLAGSRLRRDIENIMIAGERGRALVDRILAFSRSGVGERVAVHVEEVVTETLALFAAKLPRTIAMAQKLGAGKATVTGDPTQIHQVLMNLLTNAAQAMPMGGRMCVALARLHVSAARTLTTGSVTPRDYIVLEVADTGSGMPPEVLDKIFDPFFTTKEVGVGTGLGLSLVHGIVTGLGGAIDVETTVGEGTAFKVFLPLAGELASTVQAREPIRPNAQRAGHGRVLVIDDEEPLLRLVSRTLKAAGYAPVAFTAGAGALCAFRAHPERFDAVVTDESMPGMSGLDLIGQLRAIRPSLPIMLVSGYLSAAVLQRAREAGASQVLRKPLSAHDLTSALEAMLRTGLRAQ